MRNSWRRFLAPLLAAGSGVLYAASVVGFGPWPLALVCWVPFLVVLHQSRDREAAGLGFAHGLATSVLGTPWIFTTVKAMTGWSPALALLASSLLWIYQSGRTALLGWLVVRATRRGWPLGLAFGLALAGTEVSYPMLFGWYSAIAVHQVPLLLQAADIGGPIAISLALAGANVTMAELAFAWIERRRIAPRRLLLGASYPLLLVAYGAWREPAVARAVEHAPKATIAVVQANLARRFVSAAASLRSHWEPTRDAAGRERLDLAVWSETALRDIYRAQDISTLLRSSIYGTAAGSSLPPILTGIEIASEELPGNGSWGAWGERISPESLGLWERSERAARHFRAALDPSSTASLASNSAVLVNDGDGLLGRYDKNRLVPFGEYVPFGDVFPFLYRLFPTSGPTSRGRDPAPIPFGRHLLAVVICYEDSLPAYTNAIMRGGRPDLLVDLTNDVWFGRSRAAGLHFAASKFRAVEHRRFLVRAGNSGVSAFVDPTGRVVGEAPRFVAATLVGEIAWMRGTTIYEAIGDAPWWFGAFAIGAMGIVGPRRRRRDATLAPGALWSLLRRLASTISS